MRHPLAPQVAGPPRARPSRAHGSSRPRRRLRSPEARAVRRVLSRARSVAAPGVRVSGLDAAHIRAALMGAYEATGALCAGRPVYAQAGAGDGAIWYYGSNWAIGQSARRSGRELRGVRLRRRSAHRRRGRRLEALDQQARPTRGWAIKVESAGRSPGVVRKGGAAPMFGASARAAASAGSASARARRPTAASAGSACRRRPARPPTTSGRR